MKIGILSDTHNNVNNLRAALKVFSQVGVTTLIHCGDMTNPELTGEMDGFRVIYCFGNGDIASGEIRQALLQQNPENFAGLVYSGEINGTRIAATHGHIEGKLEELAQSGQYDYIFRGHSHKHEDTTTGGTRLINPGSLGGLHREARQICLLDLESGQVTFVEIDPEQ